MNSTETQTQDLLDRCQKRLLQAREALAQRGKEVIAGVPDPAAASYYTAHKPGPAVFEIDMDRFGELMETHWREEGLPELAECAPMLADLATQLRQEAAQDDSVSPFIYVMF